MAMPGLSLLLAFALSLWFGLAQPAAAYAVSNPLSSDDVTLATRGLMPAVLPGLRGVFTGTRPDGLGAVEGQLAACPLTPNCVVSQNADADHAILPITYGADRAEAREILLAVLHNQPRVNIIEQTDTYIAAEFTSRLMGFVDDVEFYFPGDEKVIHMRSAARLGESDLGVNRRRLEQFRLALASLGA